MRLCLVPLLLFLFASNTASAAPIQYSCEVDGLMCMSLFGKNIEGGVFPKALRKVQVDNLEFVDWSTAKLTNFDVALIPSNQIAKLPESYAVYDIDVSNSLVVMSNGSLQSAGLCTVDFRSNLCMDQEKAYRLFEANQFNLTTYASLYENNQLAFNNAKSINAVSPFTYILLVRDGVGIDGEILKSMLNVERNLDWSPLVIFLSFLVAASGALISYFVYKEGLVDEHSGCLSKRTFNYDKHKNLNAFTAFLIDYNNFKKVNDQFGHKLGDSLIEEVSFMILGAFRRHDKVYRLGGDEFLVVTYDTIPPEKIEILTRKLKTEAEAIGARLGVSKVNFGLSIGVDSFKKTSINKVYQALDDRMYDDKKGKGR